MTGQNDNLQMHARLCGEKFRKVEHALKDSAASSESSSYPLLTAIAHLDVASTILKQISLASIKTGQQKIVDHTLNAIELLEKHGNGQFNEACKDLTDLIYSCYVNNLAIEGYNLEQRRENPRNR